MTLVVALWLSVLPLPEWALFARPAWVVMVVLYWVMMLPGRIGIATAWGVGLLQDLVVGAPLGQNALALAVLAYLTLILYQRIRMFALVQQALVVFVFVGMNQLVCHWVQTVTGTPSSNLMFLLPALTSALLWPWLSSFIRLLHRNYLA